MTPDTSGRLWLAATTHRGDVVLRSTVSGSTRWMSPARPVQAVSPVTNSPALSSLAGHGVRLAIVARDGRLSWRRADAPGRATASGQPPHLGLFTRRASLLLRP